MRFLIILVLAGCAVKPVHFDGENVTYNHGSLRFNSVVEDAQARCASIGETAKHEGTDVLTGVRRVSTFTCVENN